MAQQIAIVPDTVNPVDTLQLQLFRVNAKVVDQTFSLSGMEAELTSLAAQIAALQAEQAALQSQYTSITNYLSSIGVTDLTKPFTSSQVSTLTAAGYSTTAV